MMVDVAKSYRLRLAGDYAFCRSLLAGGHAVVLAGDLPTRNQQLRGSSSLLTCAL
jgi:hypothetical protein